MKCLCASMILLTGCASYRSTPADKAASVARYAGSSPGMAVTSRSGQVIRLKPTGRLAMVTAWVFASDESAEERIQAQMTGAVAGNQAPAGTVPAAPPAGGMGGAVAISPDGYFLTAAHVVAFRSCWVAYASEAHPVGNRFVKARVVFSNAAADLAVIKIGMATPGWLGLEDHPGDAKGVVVFSGHPGARPAAGEILASEERRFFSGGNPAPYQRLKIEIPIMPGDSGGPVIDGQGRCRGILTDEIYGLGWKRPHRAFASMPGRAFIAALLAADRLHHP